MPFPCLDPCSDEFSIVSLLRTLTLLVLYVILILGHANTFFCFLEMLKKREKEIEVKRPRKCLLFLKSFKTSSRRLDELTWTEE